MNLPDKPITNVHDLAKRLDDIRSQANILSPVSAIDSIPVMHRASLRMVKIDPTTTKTQYTESGVDVYRDRQFCAEDEVALNKNGILKLLRAAGGSVAESKRTDDRSDPLYVEWTAAIQLRELDGNMTTHRASKTVDLRPGSPTVGGSKPWSEARIAKAAGFITDNAETKAIARAARSILQLAQKYKRSALEKPFVVPVLMADLHEACESDPVLKRQLALHAAGITTDLYGGGGPTTDGEVLDVEPVSVKDAPPPEEVYDAPPPPPSEPVGDINDCPCGDKTPMAAEHAKKSLGYFGAKRCGSCWPSPAKFDLAKHKGIEDLRLPKRKDITVLVLANAKPGAA